MPHHPTRPMGTGAREIRNHVFVTLIRVVSVYGCSSSAATRNDSEQSKSRIALGDHLGRRAPVSTPGHERERNGKDIQSHGDQGRDRLIDR